MRAGRQPGITTNNLLLVTQNVFLNSREERFDTLIITNYKHSFLSVACSRRSDSGAQRKERRAKRRRGEWGERRKERM